jgi:predicted ArsR family transcriptional regulator
MSMEQPAESTVTSLRVIPDEADAGVTSVAALAEPVRRALYHYVVAQPDPVSREQAAAGAGVARHAAKFHLDKLVDEGLLTFEYRRPPERRGPGAGRPAKVYRRSERQVSVSLPDRRYEFAGQLLARAITESERDAVPVGRTLARAAHEAGVALGGDAHERVGPDATVSAIRTAAVDVLLESGFEPRPDPEGITLANCPFHSIACEYTELACGMNLDLMKGLVSGLPGAELDARLDPAPGRCCVRLETTSPAR